LIFENFAKGLGTKRKREKAREFTQLGLLKKGVMDGETKKKRCDMKLHGMAWHGDQ
jgi:hypothetical protein